MQPSLINYTDQPCKKCNKSPSLVIPSFEHICNKCYSLYFIKKFLRTIKQKVNFTNNSKILIAFDNKLTDYVLIDLLKTYVNRFKTNKNNMFTFTIIIVEESDCNEKNDNFLTSQEFLQKYKLLFEIIYIKIDNNYKTISKNSKCNELKEIIKMKAMIEYAKMNGYNKILFGTCKESIAVNLLKSTVLGNGISTTILSNYEYERFGIICGYPLRDFSLNFIKKYVECIDLKIPTDIQNCTIKSDDISKIIHEFVNKEKNYNNLNNIVKTFCKLKDISSVQNNSSKLFICKLCGIMNIKKDENMIYCSMCREMMGKLLI